MIEGEELLQRAEVLQMLGVSAPTLRALVQRGELAEPMILPNRQHRYPRCAVDALLERMCRGIKPAQMGRGASQVVAAEQRERLGRLIGKREILERLGVSDRTLRAMKARGEFPQPLRLPTGKLLYLEAEVLAFIQRLLDARKSAERGDQ